MNETTFRCYSCDKRLRIRDPQLAGKKIRCPNCGSINAVPDPPFAPQADLPIAAKIEQPPPHVDRPAPAKAERPADAKRERVKRALPVDDVPEARSVPRAKPARSADKQRKKGGVPVVGILAALVASGFLTLAGVTRYGDIMPPPKIEIVKSSPVENPPGGVVTLPEEKKEDPKDKTEPPTKPNPKETEVGAQIDKLKNADPTIRSAAADTLGAMGKDALAAIPPLVDALADEDAEVRKKAGAAIRALGSQPTSVLIDFSASWCPPCQRMKPITTKLVKEGLPLWEIDYDKYPDLTTRFVIGFVPTFVLMVNGKETNRSSGEQSEDALRAMLKELPRNVEAPQLSADLKEPASQARWTALLLSLMDEDAWVSFEGTRAIQKQGAASVPVLTQIINGKYPAILRVGATKGLGIAVTGQLASPEVAALLKSILAEPKESVDLRGQAALIAHDLKITDDQIGPALVAAAKSGAQASLRASAVSRLGDLQSDEAVSTLTSALEDKDQRIQHAAVVALGKMGARAGTAIPALLALYARETDQSTRNSLREACQQIVPSAKEAAPALVSALKERNDQTRLLALDLLNLLDDPKAGEASLLPLLKAESPTLRVRAAIALQQMGQNVPAALPVLVETLKNEMENYEATSALHQLGKQAAPLLVGCVTEEKRTPRERMRAARILAGMAREMKSIRPALEKGLMSKDEQVRLSSALVLARMTPLNEAVVEPLVAGLKSADRPTQQECVQALAGTRHKAAAKALLAALEELDKEGEDGEDRRKSLAFALSSCELSESEIAGALNLLEKPNSRAAAAIVLAHAGEKSPKVAPALIKAFQLVDDNDRQDMREGLVDLGKPIVPDLLKLFEDPKIKESIRLDALRVLAQMGENAHEVRPTLEKYLKDPRKQVKWQVAITLASLQSDTDLVPVLLEALEDKQIGFEAESALNMLGPRAKAAVDPLCEMLTSTDRNKQAQAIRLLPAVGQDSEKASKALLALLKSKEDGNIRQSVSFSLPRFGKKIVPGLIEALSDPSMSTLDVIRILQQMGPNAKVASPALTALLLDKDRAIAIQAAVALSSVDPKQQAAVPVLLEALRSKDRAVRDSALSALGAFGPEARSAVPMLVQALQSPETRGQALSALARIGPGRGLATAKAVDAISHLLSSREKGAAIYALAAIGPEAAPAVPRLIGMLDHDQNWAAAASALGKIGGPAKQAVAVLVKKMDDEDSRQRACQALGYVGKLDPDQALPPLLKLAAEGDLELRGQAIRSLGMLQTAKAVPPLLKALKDPDLSIRLNATSALGHFGTNGAEAVPALQELLEGEDVSLRRAAAGALGELGEVAESAVPALIKALEDKEVRDTASYALGRIGAKAEKAIPPLMKLLDDPKVRSSTVRALGQFGPIAKEALPKLRELLKESKGYLQNEIQQSIEKIEGKKDKVEDSD